VAGGDEQTKLWAFGEFANSSAEVPGEQWGTPIAISFNASEVHGFARPEGPGIHAELLV